MVAAAGSCVLAVEHEFFGAQAALASLFVERGGGLDQFIPAAGRVNIHLDNAWIRGDHEFADTRILRWLVTFEDHRQLFFCRHGFDVIEQGQVGFQSR